MSSPSSRAAWPTSPPAFAAAVSNAGALGLVASGGMDAEALRAEIRAAKANTGKPFGVNLMLMNPHIDALAKVVAEEGVQVVTTGAGNPGKYVPAWKEAGIKVFPVVAAPILAKRLERYGIDGVIAEGCESGGHIGELTTMALVPQVVDAVSVPVIAAGGIADGRQLTAAFALGACGVQVGTCLLASEECPIHVNYKQAVLKAGANDTTVTGRSTGRAGAGAQKQDGPGISAHGEEGCPPGGDGAAHPGLPAEGRVRRRRGRRQLHGRPGGRYGARAPSPAADL